MEFYTMFALFASFIFFLLFNSFAKSFTSKRKDLPLPPGSMGWPYIGETFQMYSQDPNVFFASKMKRFTTTLPLYQFSSILHQLAHHEKLTKFSNLNFSFLVGMALSSSPTFLVVLVWWYRARTPQNSSSTRLVSSSQHSQQAKKGCWENKPSSSTKESTMLNWGGLCFALSSLKPSETSSPTSNPLPKTAFNLGKGNRSPLS